MAVWLGTLSLILMILFFRERAINRNLNNEVIYIRERLGTLAAVHDTRENSYILVPSENTGIRELSAQLNRLLDLFYQQKAEYQRARKAMEQVLANISHDLRTPLTVLKGYSELLMKEMRKESGFRRIQDIQEIQNIQNMAARIDQKADELVIMINEYFTMSKIESGDMKIDLQRINLTQLCHEAILDYYDVLEEAQYDVEIQMGEMPVYVCADAEALKRILKNLIDNAVKHGGDGKYLGIRLMNSSGRAAVEIEDHGTGIAPGEQEQIFSRNYTTERKGSGSGLGLAIARSLALQMGADIEVYSEPGMRTVFTLAFPNEFTPCGG